MFLAYAIFFCNFFKKLRDEKYLTYNIPLGMNLSVEKSMTTYPCIPLGMHP